MPSHCYSPSPCVSGCYLCSPAPHAAGALLIIQVGSLSRSQFSISSSVSQTKQVEQAAMVRQSWCRESSRRAWRVTGRWKEQDCSLSLDKLSNIFKPYMTSADGAMSRGGSAPAMPPLKCWEHPSPPRLHTREEEGGSRRRMEAAVLHREDIPNGRLQQTHNS